MCYSKQKRRWNSLTHTYVLNEFDELKYLPHISETGHCMAFTLHRWGDRAFRASAQKPKCTNTQAGKCVRNMRFLWRDGRLGRLLLCMVAVTFSQRTKCQSKIDKTQQNTFSPIRIEVNESVKLWSKLTPDHHHSYEPLL